jgi:non-heme chloroperoxidase
MAWTASQFAKTSRRNVFASALTYVASLTVRPSSAAGKDTNVSTSGAQGTDLVTSVTTKDGVQIFYKD